LRSIEPELIHDGGTGVIVIGHGSRAPEALELLNWVAGRLASRLGMPVLAASLQFNKPSLDDCCHELADAGMRRVVVAPYFLFDGNHLQKDIPGELERLQKELPDTELVLARSLGADELLVDVLTRRALEKADAMETVEEEPLPEGDGELLAALCAAGCGGEVSIAKHPIEVQSFEIIDSLLEPEDADDPGYQVVRRVVHTTGDPSLARAVTFSPGAIAAGVDALASGAKIYCDVNMVAVGIKPTAAGRGIAVSCLVADPQAAKMARREGMTRSAAAIRLTERGKAAHGLEALSHAVISSQGGRPPMNNVEGAGSGLDGAIVAIGNAPTALFELLRMVKDEGVRPALVVGVPVGFVGAAESKEQLMGSGVPFITIPGNRGGSSIAAAVVNALLRMQA